MSAPEPDGTTVRVDLRRIDAYAERDAEGRTTGWSVIDWAWTLWQHRSLIYAFYRRDIEIRYRGSFLGFGWMIASPMFVAVIYTYAIGYVMGTRFPGSTSLAGSGMSIYLGVILFQLTGEVLGRAPDILHEQSVFVKKSVVPLRIVPIYPLVTALSASFVSLLIFAMVATVSGSASSVSLLLPLFLLPFVISLLGASWLLSAAGAYVRDVKHTIGFVITFLLFSSPVFYPLEMVPERLRPFVFLNPMATAIVHARDLVLKGVLPSFWIFAGHVAICLALCTAGYALFRRLQPEFADVV